MPASHVDQLKLNFIPLDGSIPSTTTGDCTAGAPTGAPTGALGPTGAGNSAPASKPTALGASKGRGSSVFCVGFLLRGFGLAVHCTTCAPGVLESHSLSLDRQVISGDILTFTVKIIHVSYSPLGSLRAIRPLFRAHHLPRSRAAFIECACH